METIQKRLLAFITAALMTTGFYTMAENPLSPVYRPAEYTPAENNTTGSTRYGIESGTKGLLLPPSLYWTNGNVRYSPTLEKGGFINFSGETLHEGGYCFALTPGNKENEFKLRGGYMSPPSISDEQSGGEGDIISITGTQGDKVVYTIINDRQHLIVYNKKGEVTETFFITDNLERILEEYLIKHYFSGEYTDENGHIFSFDYNEKRVSGFSDQTQTYTIEKSYDMPCNIITLEDGRTFVFVKENGLLEISVMAWNTDDHFWEKGETVTTAKKTKSYSDLTTIKGDYPFASDHVLSYGELCFYNQQELRIMRNEIFARHGLRFSTDQMKKHFENQDWYKPTSDHVNNKLSQIELINISFIRQFEKQIENTEQTF